jgi:L-asparagine permease
VAEVSFKMPFAPLSSWLTLGFLLAVLVLTAFDYPDGTYTIAAIPVVAVALGVGWIILKGSSPFSPTIPSYILTKLVEDDDSDPR